MHHAYSIAVQLCDVELYYRMVGLPFCQAPTDLMHKPVKLVLFLIQRVYW